MILDGIRTNLTERPLPTQEREISNISTSLGEPGKVKHFARYYATAKFFGAYESEGKCYAKTC